MGLVWETYEKVARNPKTGEEVTVQRRRICRDLDLPMRDQYGTYVAQLLEVP